MAAQVDPEEATLRQLLTTAGVSAAVRDAIVEEGLADYQAAFYFSYKTVTEISSRRARQQNNVAINVVACWRIATVAFYVQGKLLMGEDPDEQEFNADMAHELQHILVTRENQKDRKVPITVPNLTDPSQWLEFKDSVESYLGSVRGVSGVPLRYVIRDDAENQMFRDANGSWDTRLWTTAQHEGAHYMEDRKVVFQLLNSKINCTDGTSAKVYFLHRTRLDEQDGKAAWEYFMNLYNSPNTANIRLNEADKELANLFFTGKKAYPFDEFSKDFELVFQRFASAGAPKSENEKLRYLLSHCPAEKMQATIADLENRVPEGLTYVQALQFLTDSARRHYPNPSSTVGIRNVGSTGTTSKKKRKKKSKGKQSLSKLLDADGNFESDTYRGVDISNVHRNFTTEEFNKLKGTDVWDHIKKKREQKKEHARGVKAATTIATSVVDAVMASPQNLTDPQDEVSGSVPSTSKADKLDQATRDSIAQSIAYASAKLMKSGGKNK